MRIGACDVFAYTVITVRILAYHSISTACQSALLYFVSIGAAIYDINWGGAGAAAVDLAVCAAFRTAGVLAVCCNWGTHAFGIAAASKYKFGAARAMHCIIIIADSAPLYAGAARACAAGFFILASVVALNSPAFLCILTAAGIHALRIYGRGRRRR